MYLFIDLIGVLHPTEEYVPYTTSASIIVGANRALSIHRSRIIGYVEYNYRCLSCAFIPVAHENTMVIYIL